MSTIQEDLQYSDDHVEFGKVENVGVNTRKAGKVPMGQVEQLANVSKRRYTAEDTKAEGERCKFLVQLGTAF